MQQRTWRMLDPVRRVCDCKSLIGGLTALSYCSICQHVKTAPIKIHAPLQPILRNNVFERVRMDLIGATANSHGCTYALVIIDAFSRWIEAIPLTNKRTETVAWALLATWICRYGWMNILHSDNGSEFVNQVMNNICDWLSIIRATTTAYHPQGNGMCERANRSLKQALTCLLLEHGTG
jgi:transposase InsO family protein